MSQLKTCVLPVVALCGILCALSVYQHGEAGLWDYEELLGRRDFAPGRLPYSNVSQPSSAHRLQHLWQSLGSNTTYAPMLASRLVSMMRQPRQNFLGSAKPSDSPRESAGDAEWGSGPSALQQRAGNNMSAHEKGANATHVAAYSGMSAVAAQQQQQQQQQQQETAAHAPVLARNATADTASEVRHGFRGGATAFRLQNASAQEPSNTIDADMVLASVPISLLDGGNSAKSATSLDGNTNGCMLRVKRELSLKITPSREAVRQKLLASVRTIMAPIIHSLRCGVHAHHKICDHAGFLTSLLHHSVFKCTEWHHGCASPRVWHHGCASPRVWHHGCASPRVWHHGCASPRVWHHGCASPRVWHHSVGPAVSR
jgi:hypothetical protein